MKPTEIILQYEGNGTTHITGVPAQNLTALDVQAYANMLGVSESEAISFLCSRGLYSEIKQDKPKKKTDNIETETVKD